MPKVSVIIPVYNTEKYLRQCLDSIVYQTLKDIEILCVDDGSTDGSLAILQEYADKDDRVKIYKGKGTGAGGARNVGLDIATGEYLSFIDSDDFIELDTYEKLYKSAQQNCSDVVVFNMNRYNTNKKIFLEYEFEVIPKEISSKNISIKDHPDNVFSSFLDSASNKFYKTQIAKKYNISFQEIKRTNDAFFSRSMLTISNRIYILNEVLLHYRVGNTTNLQSTYNNTPFEFTKALLKLRDFLIENNLYDAYEEYYQKYAILLINNHLRSMKSYPTQYFRLRNYLFKHILPEIKLKKDKIDCWSLFQIILSWIFSIRNFRFTDYKILTILGVRFAIKRYKHE